MSENNKIVIIGIGNVLLMDEGIGIHVVDELEKHKFPQNVTLYDGGTGGFKLIDLMDGANTVFFIDAVETGKPPGTIITFKSGDVRTNYRKKRYSLHDTDLLEVIKMVELLEFSPDIVIVGVQPKTINYGTTLSQELKDSIPDIINTVLKSVEKLCTVPSV
ncbi:MAG: hydrogenase maturation protease [Candidatus Scalindua sp. AMX11]|nr:MAG: Ni,Fe-hydrogenase maturation factor [Candidatus Scalindua sp.]NOG83674.1 HyaD/HybD family hydrogenase maturation endopeptidase [Planctomycetota bacterium]RZV69950.1 MAG: hydrogenase maturation protease [Candidatus Scalindua sp. SCAELEC01]TDE63891.1 MAG: hydrogenase maturation protease [Candidatus Scalindua sp. AMX11]GJQ60076.1 MAG: hydrogenase expression/formation protein [Candidatus Scalindua sp.]